jgi:hypothetical protein
VGSVTSGGASGQVVTIVIDDRNSSWLNKLIDVRIDDRLSRAGQIALSRQRLGG